MTAVIGLARPPVRVLVIDDGAGVWGAQRWLLRLAPRLGDRGVELMLACPAESALATAWVGAGHAHVDLPMPADRRIRRSEQGRPSLWLAAAELSRSATMARRIARLGRDTGADVLHGNAHWSHLETAWAGRLAGLPSLLLLHEESLPGLARHLRSISVGLATSTVAVSAAVRQQLPASRRQRVRVVLNGVDTEVFEPGPRDAALRAQLAACPEDPVVLAMSRLDPQKGVADVVRAVASTDPSLGIQLAVVGAASLDPAYEPRLRKMATDLLGPRVRFLGARADVPAILRSVDAMVLASSMEGMPLSVLEAQASGTPVVAYPTAGIPEIVTHEETGLLVHPGDIDGLAAAVTRIVGDPGLRLRLSQAGRRDVVASHTLDAQADAQAHLALRLTGVPR